MKFVKFVPLLTNRRLEKVMEDSIQASNTRLKLASHICDLIPLSHAQFLRQDAFSSAIYETRG